MVAALAIAGAGLALQTYSLFSGSRDKANAMRAQAAANRVKAEEILKRNELNKAALFRKAKEFKGKQTAQLSSSGAGLSASAMALIVETGTLAEQEADVMTREAEFQANMVLLGANSTDKAAGQIETAGNISALGSALSGGASIYAASRGKSAPSTKTPTSSSSYGYNYNASGPSSKTV